MTVMPRVVGPTTTARVARGLNGDVTALIHVNVVATVSQ